MILTGPVRSGKTSFLAGVLSELGRDRTRAAGFLSPAAFEDGRHVGYDLAALGRETLVPYIRGTGRPGWETIGPYFFIPEALGEARRQIRECPDGDLLIVDEVGPLEVGGGGLWGSLEPVLASPARRSLLVVREACLQAVLDKLGGRPARVFRSTDPATRDCLKTEIAGEPQSRRAQPAGGSIERSGPHVG